MPKGRGGKRDGEAAEVVVVRSKAERIVSQTEWEEWH